MGSHDCQGRERISRVRKRSVASMPQMLRRGEVRDSPWIWWDVWNANHMHASTLVDGSSASEWGSLGGLAYLLRLRMHTPDDAAIPHLCAQKKHS